MSLLQRLTPNVPTVAAPEAATDSLSPPALVELRVRRTAALARAAALRTQLLEAQAAHRAFEPLLRSLEEQTTRAEAAEEILALRAELARSQREEIATREAGEYLEQHCRQAELAVAASERELAEWRQVQRRERSQVAEAERRLQDLHRAVDAATAELAEVRRSCPLALLSDI